ncbi:MAG TPA: response regulator, partial [Polyangiaceae bacterium]
RPPEEVAETVRVEIAEIEPLLDGVTEAAIQIHALARETAALERGRHLAATLAKQLAPRADGDGASGGVLTRAKVHAVAEELRDLLAHVHRSVATSTEQVGAELQQLRDAVNRLRLLPVSSIFPGLERATRDAAQALRKPVSFHTTGGEGRLDGHVLAGLRDALLHAVRNAVAHGIESSAERVAAGKPAEGRVELVVERRGGHMAFLCRDDGRGIDVEALRRVAVNRGLVPSADAVKLDTEGVFQLVLRGGISTTGTVTEVSGRGVGLDVVRDTVVRLKGEIHLRSERARGTTLEISVPISLSSLPALVVEAAGAAAALPLEAVRRTVRLTDGDISRSAEQSSVVYEGKVIPFVPLAQVLRSHGTPATARRRWSAVVVGAGSALAAVGVDRLVGTENVVVRALPAHAEVDPIVAGASLDAQGNPQIVLDPTALVQAAGAAPGIRMEAESKRKKPVLIIDDSLTTRMLEQSILESAGYEVALATSAEMGLGMAREKNYGLFLVDVEMPGMDGFEFVTRTRADPVLRETPAILVTSRDLPEDRQRGRDAGALAYVVKGEFDQGYLLHTIRGVLG